MDKSGDLSSQVERLISRHAGTLDIHDASDASAATDVRNIPLLTEVVSAPDWAPGSERPRSVIADFSPAAVDALANDILTRVTERLEADLAIKLEDRLTVVLATQISAAVDNVLADLMLDIANQIGDAVNAALADHLRRSPPNQQP